MAKYGGWTLGETEAMLNVIGGTDVARSVLRGERKLTVEEIVRQQPTAPLPFFGTFVKKVVVPPYKAESIAKAIEFGRYDGVDGDIVTIFADDEVGLTEEVGVDLFQFNRNWTYDEVAAWAKANGEKKPILPKHIHGIGIGLPGEQRLSSIMETGSVRDGLLLYLLGGSGWRCLGRGAVARRWRRGYLVGFLSE